MTNRQTATRTSHEDDDEALRVADSWGQPLSLARLE
jgi:hypothetical protein